MINWVRINTLTLMYIAVMLTIVAGLLIKGLS
jgi:hypothetical protein